MVYIFIKLPKSFVCFYFSPRAVILTKHEHDSMNRRPGPQVNVNSKTNIHLYRFILCLPLVWKSCLYAFPKSTSAKQ